jgi:hypothetical protein
MYYTVKVQIEVQSEGDKIKKHNEHYLVDAESVTEAEAKIYKEFEKDSLDWEVKSVTASNIIKVIAHQE